MSDRPMRLKYLTKMKIILCIFLLCITAVSVFGESQELNGIVEKSIEFPAAVETSGNLRYSGVPIGDVTSGRFTLPRNEKYSSRVQWDSSTGLFSLSGLRLEDSGVYTVQDTHQNINTIFQLNVYKDNIPVSKPHVRVTRDEYRCTIECTAERGTEATLSWYREGEKKPYVSSCVASAPHLHLPKTVERSGTYTCEAKNSVSNEKASITVGAHCTAPSGSSAGIIVAIFIAVVALFIAVVFAVLYRRIRSENAGIRSEHAGIRSEHAGIRRLILVEKLLDNIVAAAPESRTYAGDASTGLIIDEESQSVTNDDKQAFIYYAFMRLILVQEISEDIVAPARVEKLLDILFAPASVQKISEDIVAPARVEKLLDILFAPASDTTSKLEAVRTTILDDDEQAAFISDIRRIIEDIRRIIEGSALSDRKK